MRIIQQSATLLLLSLFALPAFAQKLGDPSRTAHLRNPPRNTLTEQFIWTANDAAALNPALQSKVRGQDDKIDPHYFRAHFHLNRVPPDAVLYLAGPRAATVYVNGVKEVDFPDNHKASKGFTVYSAYLAHSLRKGDNLVAVEEVRGHSSLHTGADATINQLTYGEVLLLKIVPRDIAQDAPPVLATGPGWRSTLHPEPNWQQSTDDSAWTPVQTLGIPGTKSDFLQWNADAGLYAWPGYNGIGSAMRTFDLAEHARGDLDSNGITLDFGRELAGRLHVVSSADYNAHITIGYGESREEATRQPYLGTRGLDIPPHGEVFGPKSAFRYAHILGSFDHLSIEAQAIVYPVDYAGSFTSSDSLLNRIWETAAYTAHLCMQEDGIWDAPKRDRGRWMGDLDVTGRTISAIFADRTLMEATMTQVVGDLPIQRDVNTIAGYSALWITGQADFYRHLGDLAYLRSMQPRLLGLLAVMDAELNDQNLFTNPGKHKVFVDWSPGFNADSPDARAATHLEFTLAYREAAYLLEELGDTSNAKLYRAKSLALEQAAQTALLDPATQTFGPRWQTNAMAVVSSTATPAQQQAIWTNVLARTQDPASTDVTTPYYGYYILAAMARLGHTQEALNWMRYYWGGMLAEGATSFYEAYDPHWPKQDFHAFLEADNKRGYNASLAHGWASGPAAFLAEQVLGIQPTGPGFATVDIHPNLAGLTYARGAEPTPRGLLTVDLTPTRLLITLPPATTSTVIPPFPGPYLDNNHPIPTPILLTTPGPHLLTQGSKP